MEAREKRERLRSKDVVLDRMRQKRGRHGLEEGRISDVMAERQTRGALQERYVRMELRPEPSARSSKIIS